MAPVVVDALEAVDIDHQHRHRRLVAQAVLVLDAEARLELAAVGQARQRVGLGQRAQRFAARQAVREQLANALQGDPHQQRQRQRAGGQHGAQVQRSAQQQVGGGEVVDQRQGAVADALEHDAAAVGCAQRARTAPEHFTSAGQHSGRGFKSRPENSQHAPRRAARQC
ncbi:hypothetical protein QWP09_18445 [Cupriavidus necator]|nr:hypothetical protein [Cupriavidus necator]WKA40819.1 hypothetical protein QWP09_18445 [Cupriavidus necator]